MQTQEFIRNALGAYRCKHMIADDGDTLELSDALTPPEEETIAMGMDELDSLADFIAAYLEEHSSPTREQLARFMQRMVDEGARGKDGKLKPSTCSEAQRLIRTVMLNEEAACPED